MRSKWGLGDVWEHALDEVPSSYGNEARFYRAIPSDLAYAMHTRFPYN